MTDTTTPPALQPYNYNGLRTHLWLAHHLEQSDQWGDGDAVAAHHEAHVGFAGPTHPHHPSLPPVNWTSVPALPTPAPVVPQQREDDPWLTIGEIARTLRVSPMSIYRLVNDGRLRHTRVGKTIRIRQSWLDQHLEENTK